MNTIVIDRHSERGAAGAKFLVVLAIILLIAHAGFNYIPVAYEAESMKTDMNTAVLQGLAMPGKMNPVENVKQRLNRAVQVNALPPETFLDVKQVNNALTAHVYYQKKVNLLPFGIYKYDYIFDHTATPSGFLLKQ